MNLVMTSLHLMLLALALMMPALIYGHKREELAEGARLVMKTRSGHGLLQREARGTVSEEAAAILPRGNGGGGNKRVRNNNKKSNKSQDQGQQPQTHIEGGGRKSYKKLNQQQSQSSNDKQPRQMIKHQQQQQQLQGHQPHHEGKRSGPKVKTSENAKASTCRYAKSAWSDCDAKTNMRTRTLSLKKGESSCLPTRTMQKKCKKACRYDKGSWSDCNAEGQMTREDKLKPTDNHGAASESHNCDPVRTINKKCNPGGKQHGMGRANKERKHKEKGTRRTPPLPTQPQA